MSLFTLFFGQYNFPQCTVSSFAVHRLLSLTTLGVLCLFISEMTLSHLAVSPPPTSCSASVHFESNALERKIVEMEGKGCHEFNLRQTHIQVLCSKVPLCLLNSSNVIKLNYNTWFIAMKGECIQSSYQKALING